MNMIYISIFLCGLVVLLRKLLFLAFFTPFVMIYGKIAKGRQKLCHIPQIKPLETQSIVNDLSRTKFIQLLVNRYCSGFYRLFVRTVGMINSMHIRMFFYKYVLFMRIGERSVIYHNADIRAPYNIVIGEGVIVGDNAILDGRNGILIGDNVNFSSNISIWTEQHDHRDPWFRCDTIKKNMVIIQDRAWIGPNTIILPNASVGEGTVIAAGAVVVKKTEDYSIYVGIPAKRIGERNKKLSYIMDGTYMPFN